jgi:hypothetical protein
MNSDKTTNAKYSLILIFFENGIGSILHTFAIPFAGHLLSINQIGLLSRLVLISNEVDSPMIVSFNATLLKSLGPAGKKLTPMLAIMAQGLLFTIPIMMFGINLFTLAIGIFLATLWAFIQPALLIYIMFGNNIVLIFEKILKGVEKFIPNLQQSALYILIILIVFKILLSFLYSSFLIKLNDQKFNELINKYKKEVSFNNHQSKNKFSQAIMELFNPMFIISLIITFLFFIFMEASSATIIWALLRPIAIGLILFYGIKIITLKRISEKLAHYGFIKTANSLEEIFHSLGIK